MVPEIENPSSPIRAPKDILSLAAQSVWAKSQRDTGNDGWLPLHTHMSDSAAIAGYIWDEWLPTSTKTTIAGAVGDDPAAARALVKWMAGVHDLGKASPAFTYQVEGLTEPMRRRGLEFPSLDLGAEKTPHSVLSHLLLERWLREQGWSQRVARTFAVIPGGHHGVPPTETDLAHARSRPALIGGSELWHQVHRELADYAAAISGASRWISRWGRNPLPSTVQVLVTAAVILSDWLASADELFPFGDPRGSEERAAEAWARLRLPTAWKPTAANAPADELFRQRFPRRAGDRLRPTQTAAIAAASSGKRPGLIIIEAPTGEGKTEAALLAAEILAARTGAGGCVIALPTMSTSDAMFIRAHDWLARVPDARGDSTSQTAFLAHGKSRLNEEFQGIARVGKLNAIGDEYAEIKDLTTVVVHEWLTGRKKGVLANFVVGTIDQVLFAGLKSKHLALRHLALANKVVIIDEVHAADEYMLVYLRRVLLWLGAYQVPVILLSATLPPATRRALAEAYLAGTATVIDPAVPHPPATSFLDRKRNETVTPEESPTDTLLDHLAEDPRYPLISTVDADGGIHVHAVEASGRSSSVSLETIDDDPESLVGFLEPNLAGGGCVAVIRNTVSRAQTTADELAAAFPDARVLLVHSRFLAAHRMANEQELRDLLGPDDAPRPQRLIVVGTQVLEQSLDIDFDLMISDLAPIDLLLQRLGRLHRHPRELRPTALSQPRFVIAGVQEWTATPPRPVDGSIAVYGRYRLLRALLALRAELTTGEDIAIPARVAPLVRSAYQRHYEAPEGWEAELTAAEVEWDSARATAAAKAQTFLLGPVPPLGASLVDWVRTGVGEAEGDSPIGQAQVRDAEDSIEVLVVQIIDGQIRVMPGVEPGAGGIVDTEREPSRNIAMAVANSSVRLPPALCQRWRIDRTIGALETNAFAGWQQSSLLKGQLVLVLDEELRTTVDGSTLHYSIGRGLQIDPPREKDEE